MGILNTTPDSFSDGGQHFSFDAAVEQAEALVAAGADIIDIGGESTRPYAASVPADEELRRVVAVIQEIRRRHPGIVISIDTTKAVVAAEALAAGASIINDISALAKDPDMLPLAVKTSASVILMHMQGTPETMQINPHYDDVIAEILAFFRGRVRLLEQSGIDRGRMIIDPGIGFGKNRQHNLTIVKHLERFAELGLPVLLAHSRKRFLGDITGMAVEHRDLPTAVVSALAANKSINIIRVHDVASTRQALQIVEAIRQAP